MPAFGDCFSRSRCRELLLEETAADDVVPLERLSGLLFDNLHLDYRVQQERLKQLYESARAVSNAAEGDTRQQLVQSLQSLLVQGHYRRVETAELERALRLEAVFRVRLHVRLEDFSSLELYVKGTRSQEQQTSDWLGLRRRTSTVEFHQRVVMFAVLRPAKSARTPESAIADRRVFLRLFENIPAVDIEMLLPNTEVGMRAIDHAVIFLPAVVGGIGALIKLSASLALLWVLILFWLGFRERPPDPLDRAAMLACAVGVFAFGSHVFRQIARFRHRKTEFLRTLSENLYFKNLDNDAGVFHLLADEAEEEECKEALLTYVLLQRATQPLSQAQLEAAVDGWLKAHGVAAGTLSVSEGLAQLQRQRLVESAAGGYRAVGLTTAVLELQARWADHARGPSGSGVEAC